MNLTALPSLGTFLDPLALAIVGGGTVLAVMLRTPVRDLGRGMAALGVLGRKPFDAEPLLAQIASLTRIVRRHGVIALDRSVIEDSDIAAAAAMIVDRGGPEAVRDLVVHRRAARYERHVAAAGMWSAAAEIAPSMGMIGTLIGLVQMFMSMRDPATIGAAMAVALLTTLYGAVVATLIASPIAARLKRLSRAEAQERARLEAPLVTLAEIEPAVRRERAELAA
jgi:chemotaxis protein MotA